jgi:uncharacterized protein YaeQ
MAIKATICKAELQISDMDRHYYATHALTLAQHPSETDERLMLRLLAFALHASERLVFGKGISSEDEPDVWCKSPSGEIELWIELGQPAESRLRKACGRAQQVVVLGYGGRGFGLWWSRNAAALERHRNLSVLEIGPDEANGLLALFARSMSLQCLIEDRAVQLMGPTDSVALTPIWHRRAAGSE